MRARFVIAPPGGGQKTEISSFPGGGWLIREFAYDGEGKRTKLSEKQNASEADVVEALKVDPDFYARLTLLDL